MPKVIAVILSWNNGTDIIGCVESLGKAKRVPDEILVVDNFSTDGSFEIITGKLSDKCRIIRTEENLGYPGGMQVGAEYSLTHGADMIWFLNNDTIVGADTLAELLAAVERNGIMNLYSPKILHQPEKDRPYFAGYFMDVERGEFVDMRNAPSPQYGAAPTDLISDVVQGSCFLLPAQVMRKYGFMDCRYFAYFEEFDYSMRLARKGVKSFCVLSAVIHHKGEGSDDAECRSFHREYYRVRNQIRFWRRCCRWHQAARYIGRYAVKQIRLGKRRGFRDDLTRARMRAVWHGLIGKSGRCSDPR